ncbi:exonuclease mut-7 homolog [Pholidichthys leucotaenia]
MAQRAAEPQEAGVDATALRDELLELWSLKDMKSFHFVALQRFSKLSEPLEDLLMILESCPGKQKGRSSTIGYWVLHDFHTWLKEHPQVNLSSLPKHQIGSFQRRALSLVSDAQPNLMDHLIEIYQLSSCDLAVLRKHIESLQYLNCYKEAAALAMKLNFQNELDMEEMCIPLILQDKVVVAESFVSGHSHLEQQLVTMLDSWCQPNFDLENVRRRFPRLPLPKRSDHLQTKILSKYILRLMEKFRIDQSLVPNVAYKRRLDSLRYLMYKRFVEKTMSEENWCDNVQVVVADDMELQVQLVMILLKYEGLEKASQWSLRYNLPRNRLPYSLWETQQSLPTHLQQVSPSDSESEDWEPCQSHRQKFYQVPLPKNHVHFVDTPDALHRCQSVILKEGAVVGVDMEWQPMFGIVGSTQRVALIQLAVSDHVFLLDVCADGFCHHPELVDFIRKFLSDGNILKLGYGMSGDLQCLFATWPQLAKEPLKMVGMLDLLNIHKKIQRCKVVHPQTGPSEVLVGENGAERGLSLLVQKLMGRPLDKTEQLSNWERRPLRVSQIRYAVADAYCLLDVFSILSSDPASFGLPADLRSISTGQSDKSKDRKQKDKRDKQTSNTKECEPSPRVGPSQVGGPGPAVAPQQLRVVCDNMLQGLGRYLRSLGVDVVMLENDDDHRVAAKLAQAEGRVILTSGQPFNTLRSQVAEGRCLSLDCSEKARDQAVRVLRHFNVQPTPNDIFSRCQACNSDQYVAIPRDDMIRMLKQKGFLTDDANPTPQEDKPPTADATAPWLPRYAPQCRWASLSSLDPDTLSFPGGSPLQLHTVHPAVLPRIPVFYVCTRCGKIFWDGSHFGRVLTMFQDVLNVSDGEEWEVDDDNKDSLTLPPL